MHVTWMFLNVYALCIKYFEYYPWAKVYQSVGID